MSILRELLPTEEEFVEAVKNALKRYKTYSADDIEKMIKSEDGIMCIKDEYTHDRNLFENGKITRNEFLNGGANAVAFNLDMTY